MLYRLLDKRGGLLYVGIAGNPGRRFEEHAKVKEWWPEVQWINVEQFPTRQQAEQAERKAIRGEQPKHNLVGVEPGCSAPTITRLSSAFTALRYSNPSLEAAVFCLLISYGALVFAPVSRFAQANLGISPRLGGLYPIAFTAGIALLLLELWRRSVEEEPTVLCWLLLLLALGLTAPIVLWGDTPMFRLGSPMEETYTNLYLVAINVGKWTAMYGLFDEYSWRRSPTTRRRLREILRNRTSGMRGASTERIGKTAK